MHTRGCVVGARRFQVLLLALTACSGGAASSDAGQDLGTDLRPELPPADAPADVQNPVACPATYSGANGVCSASNTHCVYPQGLCICAGLCTGVYVPEPPPPSWVCQPLRTDGCPVLLPAAGSACTPEGKTCSYDECCIYRSQCTGGTWKTQAPMCPA